MKKLFIFALALLVLPTVADNHGFTYHETKVKLIKVSYSIHPLYDTEIYNHVKDMGYSSTMAMLIVAQARLESGGYTSRLFRKGHNAFGMMKHKKDTLALPETLYAEGRPGYAKYRSLEESTKAVMHFLSRKKCTFNFTSVNSYCVWLKKVGYYETTVEKYKNALHGNLLKVDIIRELQYYKIGLA